MKKLLLTGLALLCIVSSAVTAGCEKFNIEESVHLIVEKMSAIESYRQDTEMTMSVSGTIGGETGEISMDYLLSCIADNVQNRAWLTLEMNLGITEIDPVSLGIEAYLIDDTVYLSSLQDGESEEWYITQAETEKFRDLTSLDTAIDLLESSRIRQTGTEKINGTDCYVVEIIPDSESLADYTLKNMNVFDEMSVPLDKGMIQKLTENITLTCWIAKDSFYVMKQNLVMEADLSEIVPELNADSFVVTADITMTLSDINKAFEIELPEDAGRAVSLD
jgi:outer membrane lipoprotein-sorting protein